ncbi:MAG: hypothetical protein EOO58_03500 [Hymenobacter sp.]|nr:MAG: hypothetical protein EOO58_03500 [Hymenobacter sp.]
MTATKEPLKRGRSYNQALLQQRLLVALTEQYPTGSVALCSVSINVLSQILTPDLATFRGAKRLLKPDVSVATE